MIEEGKCFYSDGLVSGWFLTYDGISVGLVNLEMKAVFPMNGRYDYPNPISMYLMRYAKEKGYVYEDINMPKNVNVTK